MADHYEYVTVEPYIPAHRVTALERALLHGYGFACEPAPVATGPLLYFLAEQGVSPECTGVDRLVIHADTTPLGQRLRTWLAASGGEAGEPVELPPETVSWERLFQAILQRAAATGQPLPDAEIVVMGAWVCSRMRPGEFGGWVTRITASRIQHGNTYQWLEQFRTEDAAPGAA